ISEVRITKMKRLSIAILLLLALGAGVVSAQDDGTVTLGSTQFNVVEETEIARALLEGFEAGTVDFIPFEEGPLLDLLSAEAQSGAGTIDVVGALHGTFPTLVNDDVLFDLT